MRIEDRQDRQDAHDETVVDPDELDDESWGDEWLDSMLNCAPDEWTSIPAVKWPSANRYVRVVDGEAREWHDGVRMQASE